MFHANPLAERASAIISERTEQNFEVPLAEHGVKDPAEIPEPLQLELLQSATLGAAATTCPTGNIEKLRHWLRSDSHPAFHSARHRIALSCRGSGNAFEKVRGINAAIVLAGWGLPVAPFDLSAMRIKAKPSNDIDVVQDLFAADKGAHVGDNSCDAPFYLVLTDCLATLRQLVPVHPMLAELRQLFAREGSGLPDPGQPFQQGMTFLRRQVGDAISTVEMVDPDLDGAMALCAGWRLDGERLGAPNEGYVPVAGQLLRAVLDDPRVGWWFWLDPNASKAVH